MIPQPKLIVVVAVAALVCYCGCLKKNASFLRGDSAFGQPSDRLSSFAANGSGSATKATVAAPPKSDPQAPDQFQVRFQTTKGDFVAEINREWSPRGVDRFHRMVSDGYFQEIAIFRAVPNFMFQFGLHGNPDVNKDWAEARIQDDTPVGISNLPGTLCFAKTGAPNSRSVQMFVNLGPNASLDGQGFTPFGKVIHGMDVVRAINTEYGENPQGEDVQGKIKREGNDYVLKRFPRIDLIRSVEFEQPNG